MGRDSEPNFPHTGWEWAGVVDSCQRGLSQEEYPSCEYCDQLRIRYVHTLTHPNFPNPVAVGCVCAVWLTDDQENPERAEKKLRQAADRRARFPSRKWQVMAASWRWITLDGVDVAIFPSGKAFKVEIDNEMGKLTFPTLKEAQLVAYDVVQ